MKPLSNEIRKQIENGLAGDLSNRQIATKFNVSAGSVDIIAKKVFPNGRPFKSGRPPKLSERQKWFCARQISSGRAENASQVQQILKNDLNIEVVPRTVRNALQNVGFERIIKPRKPMLSQKNVKYRLSWARSHADNNRGLATSNMVG